MLCFPLICTGPLIYPPVNSGDNYYQGGQEGVLNFLPPIPCITGPCPFFLAFLPQWGISGKSWWGCATRFSKSWSYFRQKLSLSTPVFSPKITYICLKSYQIRILSCFLVHLELKWQIRLYTPVVPLKTIPGSRPKCAKSIPFFRLKRPNNPILWGSTYLYGF